MSDLLAAIRRKARHIASQIGAVLDALGPRPSPAPIPVRVADGRTGKAGRRG